ncbi:hypothetical protein ACSNOI_41360, partial [Actinomadura kijaniata]|uniref:hypothetical protein n=1 Tax=Actinomadura kijaniata TaxID=46161 RepID=UPI003F1A3589
MKPVGLTEFEQRVAVAARTLLGSQGHDGGWGLTLTSVSSIVNTAEVLAILHAADVAGTAARRGVEFLCGAVADHCRPRQAGGRGENTRFVVFALQGLLENPVFLAHPPVPAAIEWCVGWLEGHRVEHGWPEVAGIDDTSLHQTALAVSSLARLRERLGELGPGVALAGGIDT